MRRMDIPSEAPSSLPQHTPTHQGILPASIGRAAMETSTTRTISKVFCSFLYSSLKKTPKTTNYDSLGASPDGAGFKLPVHSTPASSPWLQLCLPQDLARHRERAASVPAQVTSSSQMGPDPCPKAALNRADSAWPQPTSLHTTSASVRLQLSSHTVPHLPLWKTSTLPEQKLEPFTSLV